jgi:integrase
LELEKAPDEAARRACRDHHGGAGEHFGFASSGWRRLRIKISVLSRIDDPKSHAGKRTVAFPADIVPELADHLERFADPKPNGLVFIGPKGGRLRRSNFRKFWHRARGAVDLPELHFHDLRHTGSTNEPEASRYPAAGFRVREGLP